MTGETKPRSGRPLQIGCVLVGLVMAGTILRDGAADRAVLAKDGMAALRLRGDLASGQAYAAEGAFRNGDRAAAAAHARAALARQPLNVVALRTLAQIADGAGDTVRAATLMGASGALTWRDTPTQAWLMQQAASVGDYVTMMERADALARRQQIRDEVFALMQGALALPDARAALVDRLADEPAWRPAFFARLAPASPEATTGAEALLRALRATPAPPRGDEIAPYLVKLFLAGHARDARRLAQDLLPSRAADDIGQVDPVAAHQASPFAWQLDGSDQLAPMPAAAPDDLRALLIEDAGPQAAPVAHRGFALAPGRYSLRVRLRVDVPDLAPRLGFSVDCVGGGGRLAMLTPPTTLPVSRWSPLAVSVVVPAAECEGQVIAIRLGAADHRATGALWIGDVRLEPLAP